MDIFLSQLIQFYLNNVTHPHRLTSHICHVAPQHGNHIATVDYCDVALPYVLSRALYSC